MGIPTGGYMKPIQDLSKWMMNLILGELEVFKRPKINWSDVLKKADEVAKDDPKWQYDWFSKMRYIEGQLSKLARKGIIVGFREGKNDRSYRLPITNVNTRR